MPEGTGATRSVPGGLDLTAFIPANRDRYEYSGSLTTPPCTEGVRWAVLMTPLTVAADEVGGYRKLFPTSNRRTQPRRGRQISVVSD
jgi:carbonic anhydrase